MTVDFDHTPERRNSECYKWQTFDSDVIPMWVADMDFRSPDAVIQALVERSQHGVFGYPRGLYHRQDDLSELRQVVIARLAQRYAWQVEPEALVFLPGVVTSFHLACLAFAAPQGGVLVQTPVYPPILNAARNTSVLPQEMHLSRTADGTYEIDFEAFEAAINPHTQMFILCNPHNPVGRVFNQVELASLAEICLRRNVLICSDEIHSDLVYPDNKHIPIASLAPEIAARTVTLIAPSKTFNLAGLQCSIAIIQNPALRQQYQAATKGLVPWVNLMGLVAAQAAYLGGAEWLEQLLDYLRGNRDWLVDFVRQEMPGLSMGMPEGTYLAWLDCRNAGLPGNPFRFFLEKSRVALSDGEAFGQDGAGFVRLNFGCSRALLVEALQRMSQSLK